MCSRKRLTFIKDFINNESVCHFKVVQQFKLSTKDKTSLFMIMKKNKAPPPPGIIWSVPKALFNAVHV